MLLIPLVVMMAQSLYMLAQDKPQLIPPFMVKLISKEMK